MNATSHNICHGNSNRVKISCDVSSVQVYVDDFGMKTEKQIYSPDMAVIFNFESDLTLVKLEHVIREKRYWATKIFSKGKYFFRETGVKDIT